MKKMALLIVDVQNALVEEHPFNETDMIDNICKLINTAKKSSTKVVYVRHDGGVGDELEANTSGWEIYKEVTPSQTNQIVEKKFNSSFKDTDLQDILNKSEINTLIIAGMQTEYCIDATIKSAFEHGYKVIVPKKSTATFDNEFFTGETILNYYEKKIWNGRFARVIPIDQVMEEMLD